MTDEQYKAIKATFPWKTQVLSTGLGGLVQVLDNQGHEVPIFTMTELLELLTGQLAKERTQND